MTAYDQYPRARWDDASIIDYFEHRFGGSPLSSVDEGIYDHLPGEGRAKTPTRFWVGIRARAAELLERHPREVRPGHDYALSEIVHCKSPREIGVPQALATCADAYLEPVLRASAARVIVVTGTQAAKAVRLRYDLDEEAAIHGPFLMGGKERMLAFIPHPTSFESRKTFRGCLDAEEDRQLKQWLAS